MKAKNQARIFSSTKTALQDAVPLRTPYSVHIDVCSVCNFRCSFCFQSNQAALKEKGVKLGLMDVTLFKKIVDDLTDFEDKISYFVELLCALVVGSNISSPPLKPMRQTQS